MNINLLFSSAFLLISQVTYASYEMYSINLPEDAKPQINKKQIVDTMNEKKKKGYVEQTSYKYEYLSQIENRIKFDSLSNVQSTQLKKNLSEIVTHSVFKTVPLNVKSETLGYAPVGSFNKETGWTGMTEIFKSKELGLCQFSHFDLKASNGGYSLSEKDERRDVNGKYTFVEVTGKKNQGFDYEVDWFEDLNMYTLNCINKEFSNDFIEKVINLAKKVDIGSD